MIIGIPLQSPTTSKFPLFALIGASLRGFWLLVLITPALTSAEDTRIEKLRVITYNVQFLPEPASSQNERPDPEYRARRIAEETSKFDIIALQETFHKKHRGLILSGVKQHWNGDLHSLESPTPESFFTSGGCLLLSRRSIVESNSKVFANFSKPADYGFRADGFAAKGVIHARIACKNGTGAQLDLFATHLEARADELRPLQYAELGAFVSKISNPQLPAIIVGDMNTRGEKSFREDSDSQYSQLVAELMAARPEGSLIDVWPHLKGDALGGTNKQESHDIGKRIDYIFVLNPPAPNAQLKPVSVDVRLYQDERVTALSDHNAVTTELEWQYH